MLPPGLLLLSGLLGLACCSTATTPEQAELQRMWDPLGLHLFVDTAGLAVSDGLALVQHRPTKTYEMAVLPDKPWDGGGPRHGVIGGYCSAVQVSSTELRLYYDTFGQYGRFLCVAVSRDAGNDGP